MADLAARLSNKTLALRHQLNKASFRKNEINTMASAEIFFNYTCPSGSYITSITYRTGYFIDELSANCSDGFSASPKYRSADDGGGGPYVMNSSTGFQSLLAFQYYLYGAYWTGGQNILTTPQAEELVTPGNSCSDLQNLETYYDCTYYSSNCTNNQIAIGIQGYNSYNSYPTDLWITTYEFICGNYPQPTSVPTLIPSITPTDIPTIEPTDIPTSPPTISQKTYLVNTVVVQHMYDTSCSDFQANAEDSHEVFFSSIDEVYRGYVNVTCAMNSITCLSNSSSSSGSKRNNDELNYKLRHRLPSSSSSSSSSSLFDDISNKKTSIIADDALTQGFSMESSSVAVVYWNFDYLITTGQISAVNEIISETTLRLNSSSTSGQLTAIIQSISAATGVNVLINAYTNGLDSIITNFTVYAISDAPSFSPIVQASNNSNKSNASTIIAVVVSISTVVLIVLFALIVLTFCPNSYCKKHIVPKHYHSGEEGEGEDRLGSLQVEINQTYKDNYTTRSSAIQSQNPYISSLRSVDAMIGSTRNHLTKSFDDLNLDFVWPQEVHKLEWTDIAPYRPPPLPIQSLLLEPGLDFQQPSHVSDSLNSITNNADSASVVVSTSTLPQSQRAGSATLTMKSDDSSDSSNNGFIGQGGFGKVYRVQWSSRDLLIASHTKSQRHNSDYPISTATPLESSRNDAFTLSDTHDDDHQGIVVKLLLSHHRSSFQDDIKLLKTALEEVDIVKKAEHRMVHKDAIIKVHGVCFGRLPQELCRAFNVSEKVNVVGIVMRYESGGSLQELIHPSITGTRNNLNDVKNKSDGSAFTGNTTNVSINTTSSSNSTANHYNHHFYQNNVISMVEKLRILKEIARGLAELHALGIIHGDIKPDNVLLSSRMCDDFNNDGYHSTAGDHVTKNHQQKSQCHASPKVRLADFGLSKQRHQWTGSASTIQHTLRLKGTPIYCAPEMFINPYADEDNGDYEYKYKAAKASRKTDMYAFAILMWEVITEAKPFNDIKDEMTLCCKIHQGHRPPIHPNTTSSYSNSNSNNNSITSSSRSRIGNNKISYSSNNSSQDNSNYKPASRGYVTSPIPIDCPHTIVSLIQSCWSSDRSERKTAAECYLALSQAYNLMTNMAHDVLILASSSSSSTKNKDCIAESNPISISSSKRCLPSQYIFHYILKTGFSVNYLDISNMITTEKSSSIEKIALAEGSSKHGKIDRMLRSMEKSQFMVGHKAYKVMTQSKVIIVCLNRAFVQDKAMVLALRDAIKQNKMLHIIPLFLEPNYQEWLSDEIKYCCQLGSKSTVSFDLSNELITLFSSYINDGHSYRSHHNSQEEVSSTATTVSHLQDHIATATAVISNAVNISDDATFIQNDSHADTQTAVNEEEAMSSSTLVSFTAPPLSPMPLSSSSSSSSSSSPVVMSPRVGLMEQCRMSRKLSQDTINYHHTHQLLTQAHESQQTNIRQPLTQLDKPCFQQEQFKINSSTGKQQPIQLQKSSDHVIVTSLPSSSSFTLPIVSSHGNSSTLYSSDEKSQLVLSLPSVSLSSPLSTPSSSSSSPVVMSPRVGLMEQCRLSRKLSQDTINYHHTHQLLTQAHESQQTNIRQSLTQLDKPYSEEKLMHPSPSDLTTSSSSSSSYQDSNLHIESNHKDTTSKEEIQKVVSLDHPIGNIKEEDSISISNDDDDDEGNYEEDIPFIELNHRLNDIITQIKVILFK